MPSVLSYTNAFPGIPMPQYLAGQTKVQNFLYSGALQPLTTGPTVLSYTKAFPGIPLPQHLSSQTRVQSFLYPGALQPAQKISTTAFIVQDSSGISIFRIRDPGWNW